MKFYNVLLMACYFSSLDVCDIIEVRLFLCKVCHCVLNLWLSIGLFKEKQKQTKNVDTVPLSILNCSLDFIKINLKIHASHLMNVLYKRLNTENRAHIILSYRPFHLNLEPEIQLQIRNLDCMVDTLNCIKRTEKSAGTCHMNISLSLSLTCSYWWQTK